jgi:hypothetical protein
MMIRLIHGKWMVNSFQGHLPNEDAGEGGFSRTGSTTMTADYFGSGGGAAVDLAWLAARSCEPM